MRRQVSLVRHRKHGRRRLHVQQHAIGGFVDLLGQLLKDVLENDAFLKGPVLVPVDEADGVGSLERTGERIWLETQQEYRSEAVMP
jgi:hypothetical protein